MTIRLHIEKVILDGVNVAPGQYPLVMAAMQAELARLLGQGGLAPALASDIAVPTVRAGDVSLAPDASPQEIGRQIARSVYGGLGR